MIQHVNTVATGTIGVTILDITPKIAESVDPSDPTQLNLILQILVAIGTLVKLFVPFKKKPKENV